MEHSNVTPSPCPECGEMMDAATCMEKDASPPSVGDVTVCIDCTAILVFDKDMKLERPTDDLLRSIPDETRKKLKGVQKLIKLKRALISYKDKKNKSVADHIGIVRIASEDVAMKLSDLLVKGRDHYKEYFDTESILDSMMLNACARLMASVASMMVSLGNDGSLSKEDMNKLHEDISEKLYKIAHDHVAKSVGGTVVLWDGRGKEGGEKCQQPKKRFDLP